MQCAVGGGGEKNLPLTALAAVPEGPDKARTRKSLQAAIQEVAAHKHQTVVDAHNLALQRKLVLEQCVANRDAENQKLRMYDLCPGPRGKEPQFRMWRMYVT